MGSTDPSSPLLCLASASPRRRELLAQIGVPHLIRCADIDESVLSSESPREYVIRMARTKALAVHPQVAPLPVLAADTSVILDGVIFGKPADQAAALAMLERLSGRTHEVLTAVALVSPEGLAETVSLSTVTLRPTTEAERVSYWDSGEPRDKAGGYAIQGYGAVFIAAVAGSYSGVVGLPLFETAALLRDAGIGYWQRA